MGHLNQYSSGQFLTDYRFVDLQSVRTKWECRTEWEYNSFERNSMGQIQKCEKKPWIKNEIRKIMTSCSSNILLLIFYHVPES